MHALASELHADIRSARALSALSTGLVVAALAVIFAPTLAAILFSGPMAAYIGRGTGAILFGSIALCLVFALTGNYRGAIAVPVFGPAAVLFSIGGGITVVMADSGSEAIFVTMVVIVAVSTLAGGLCFLVIGHFRLARFFQFIPFPVIGGFLAGVGGLLVTSGVSVICGMPLTWRTLPQLLEPDIVWKWAPSAVFALGLAAATRIWSSPLIVPACGALALLLCHAALLVMGISLEEARAAGVLYQGMPSGASWPPLGPGDLARADWGVVVSQLPGILGVVLVTLMSIVLNSSALETATGVDFDLDREFRAGGIACIVAGGGASPPGCSTNALSLIAHTTGAETRLTGIFAAILMGVVLVFDGSVLEMIPSSLLGGVVLFISLGVLNDWLLATRKTMPPTDYGIVLVIALVIWFVGIPEGVGTGLAAALIVFVARFSGIDVIEESFTSRERRSRRIRPAVHRTILDIRGERLRAYRLGGHVIFGNAAPLGKRLKRAIGAEPAPVCLLIDLAAVAGFDVSAANVLRRCVLSAREAGTRLVLSGMPIHVRSILGRCLGEDEWRCVIVVETLDDALERAEDLIIDEWERESRDSEAECEALFERSIDSALCDLEHQARFEALTDRLGPWLRDQTFEAGQTIVKRGENPPGLQLVVEGRARESDGTHRARVDEYAEGDVLATEAAFEDHVVAETSLSAEGPCRTALMTQNARRSLEREDPELAVDLDRYLVETFRRRRAHPAAPLASGLQRA